MRENSFSKYLSELSDKGINFIELASKYGTPLYFFDANIIRENYRRLHSVISKYWNNLLICYAYKANTLLSILKIVHELGAGAEVVSGGELYAAKLVGVPSDMIIFDGVSKGLKELFEAVYNEILMINIENLDELRLINEFASVVDFNISVGVRVNFNIPVNTHRHISTGMYTHKFGLDVKQAFEAYRHAREYTHIDVKGIHVHIGSQILNCDSYLLLAEKVLSFSRRLKNELGISLSYVDLGGGFGIPYHSGDAEFPLEEYGLKVVNKIADGAGEVFDDNLTLVLEPGRYIVGNAGYLLTTVNYVKSVNGVNWVLVDAGMNDMLRPALYSAYHPIFAISSASSSNKYSYNVAGPVCESSDVFGFNVLLPEISRGDLIIISEVGAYGFSMSSQYNSRPRAAAILLDGDKIKLIRRRELYSDLFYLDVVDP